MRECREGRISDDPHRGHVKLLAETRTSEPIRNVDSARPENHARLAKE
jgi:hypothetical protein